MVKYETFEQLKKDIAYTFSVYTEKVALKCIYGTICIYDKIRTIQLAREVKALDLQNVEPDAIQIANGKGDYDQTLIKRSLDRINIITRSSYSIDFVTNDNVVTNG